jgi:hypothetical protein
MTLRRPLVTASGSMKELPSGDLLPVATLLEAFRAPIYAGDLDSAPLGWITIDGSTAHVPASGVSALLETFVNEDDTAKGQVAYLIDNRIAERFWLGGSWGAWAFFYSGHEAWTDITGKPSTFTPSTHTHAISDVTSLQATLDAKVPLPATSTKTICHSNGGLGGSVATNITLTSVSFRWDVCLPVTTTQWRIKFRNYDLPSATNKTALTGKKFGIGDHAVSNSATAYETGTFLGSVKTELIASDFSIPNTNTWYTSSWFTNSGDQFTEGAHKLLYLAWQAAGSFSMQTGAGKSWYWTNLTSAPDATIAGSGATVGYIPIDWIIEYQTSTSKDVYLWIGDSISEGIQGTKGTSGASIAPTSLWRAFPNQWAAANDAIVNNISLAGISGAYFGGTSTGLWTRCDHSGVTYRGVVIALFSNDVSSSQTLGQIQTNFLNMCATARTLFGSTVEIWACLVIPRNTLTGIPPVNDWLAQLPGGITGVIDLNSPMRGVTVNTIAAEVTCDTIHPSYQGTTTLVQATSAGLVRSKYGL